MFHSCAIFAFCYNSEFNYAAVAAPFIHIDSVSSGIGSTFLDGKINWFAGELLILLVWIFTLSLQGSTSNISVNDLQIDIFSIAYQAS